MGSASSRTRRLTVENEEQPCVIKVSDEVVKRLKKCEEEVSQSQGQQVVPFPPLPHTQVPVYYYDPRLTTTLQSQQEKIEALKRNDEYWEKRITDLENCHKEIHKVMEGEYNKAVAELGVDKKLYPCDTPPCQISKRKVIDCYKEYPKQPMRCLKEVRDFTQCVDVQRSILIDNKARS